MSYALFPFDQVSELAVRIYLDAKPPKADYNSEIKAVELDLPDSSIQPWTTSWEPRCILLEQEGDHYRRTMLLIASTLSRERVPEQ